jgi:hypothetical protein
MALDVSAFRSAVLAANQKGEQLEGLKGDQQRATGEYNAAAERAMAARTRAVNVASLAADDPTLPKLLPLAALALLIEEDAATAARAKLDAANSAIASMEYDQLAAHQEVMRLAAGVRS